MVFIADFVNFLKVEGENKWILKMLACFAEGQVITHYITTAWIVFQLLLRLIEENFLPLLIYNEQPQQQVSELHDIEIGIFVQRKITFQIAILHPREVSVLGLGQMILLIDPLIMKMGIWPWTMKKMKRAY